MRVKGTSGASYTFAMSAIATSFVSWVTRMEGEKEARSR